MGRQKEEPTNDIDLKPEKKPPASTVKRQKETLSELIERINNLKSIAIAQRFDRLKFAIDLDIWDKAIGFQLGNGMVKTSKPFLTPEKQYFMLKKGYDFGEYDDTTLVTEEEKEEFKQRKSMYKKYPNCSIAYNIYRQLVGVKQVYIYNNLLVIDITGKLMAKYGDLGCLTINNIQDALDTLIGAGLFYFDTEKFLQYAKCFLCDVTLDIDWESNDRVKHMINAMGSFCPLLSNTCNYNKYGRHGLSIRKKAENSGYSLVEYDKSESLSHSVLKETKPVRYTETIGLDGENIARRTQRLECHIHRYAPMRKLLDLPDRNLDYIPLLDVLNSKAPVLLNVFRDFGVNLEELKDSLEWYQPISKSFAKKEDMPYDSIRDMLAAERMAEIFRENDFRASAVKNHIKVEYNWNPKDRTIDRLMSYIKENLYHFLVYKKPKTVTLIITLLKAITDIYDGTELL